MGTKHRAILEHIETRRLVGILLVAPVDLGHVLLTAETIVSREMKREKTGTQRMVMDEIVTAVLSNIHLFVREVLRQTQTHAFDANRGSIRTMQLIQSSV